MHRTFQFPNKAMIIVFLQDISIQKLHLKIPLRENKIFSCCYAETGVLIFKKKAFFSYFNNDYTIAIN